MSEDEIQALVDRARNGEAVAFDQLYRHFAPGVYGFFRFRVRSAESAEDLMQKVFLKMIEQLPSYRNTGVPFAAWLYRVARNAWIDEHRRRRETEPLETIAEMPGDQEDMDHLADRSFQWDRVEEALRHLPDDQREVIACRFFADLTPGETAAQMGRSEVSVRVLQHRALAAVRRRMRVEPPSRREEAVQ
jgi:RNA polymerase sigma-70 factor (ECF subfamily)